MYICIYQSLITDYKHQTILQRTPADPYRRQTPAAAQVVLQPRELIHELLHQVVHFGAQPVAVLAVDLRPEKKNNGERHLICEKLGWIKLISADVCSFLIISLHFC